MHRVIMMGGGSLRRLLRWTRRSSSLHIVLGVSVNRLRLGRWMFGVRCWMFVICLRRHQFHPTFGTFTRMILHNFGMHDASVLRGFRFRSLRQERGCDRRD